MTRNLLTVPDISCEHCERAITAALSPLTGVRSVKVDIPAHRVAVEYDESAIALDRITEVLSAEDYPVAAIS